MNSYRGERTPSLEWLAMPIIRPHAAPRRRPLALIGGALFLAGLVLGLWL